MINLIQHTGDINKDFSALYFALYMQGEWGVEVGYKPIPLYLANMRKRLCDYQILSAGDCNNELFIESQGNIDYDCCPSGSTRVEGAIENKCCPSGYSVPISTIDAVNIYGLCYPNGVVTHITDTVPFIPCTICCPPGSTKQSTPPQMGCCPPTTGNPYIYQPYTPLVPAFPNGRCIRFAPDDPTPVAPVDCPCCPDGFTYDKSKNTCVGATGITTDPIVCPDVCIQTGTGIIVPFVNCSAYCVDGTGTISALIGCPNPVPDSIILEYPTLDTSGCNKNIVRCWDGQC